MSAAPRVSPRVWRVRRTVGERAQGGVVPFMTQSSTLTPANTRQRKPTTPICALNTAPGQTVGRACRCSPAPRCAGHTRRPRAAHPPPARRHPPAKPPAIRLRPRPFLSAPMRCRLRLLYRLLSGASGMESQGETTEAPALEVRTAPSSRPTASAALHASGSLPSPALPHIAHDAAVRPL